MRLSMLSQSTRRAIGRIKRSIVRDCPPELYACEVCESLACSREEWLECEKRLAAARAEEVQRP
jgi:hypothetical protein